MQLDTVTIRCTAFADMRRLRRAGGAIWEGRQGRSAYWLVRLPAVVALRMGLIGLGAELPEVTARPEREHERCHVKRVG